MADDSSEIFSASAYRDSRAWDALIELARAIVTLNDRDKGEGCDTASVYVSDWGAADDPKRPGYKLKMVHVSLTLSMPASLARAALSRARVLKDDDDQLGKDQEIRFSLLEME